MSRIVELKDQTPLVIHKDQMDTNTIAVCRCGLSANWPYCNGTHKATVGEDPEKLYRYERELPQGAVRRVELGEAEGLMHQGAQRPERPKSGEPAHHKAEADEGEAGVDPATTF